MVDYWQRLWGDSSSDMLTAVSLGACVFMQVSYAHQPEMVLLLSSIRGELHVSLFFIRSDVLGITTALSQ